MNFNWIGDLRNQINRLIFWTNKAFWRHSDWKGPIRGIKIGDSRENVVKVLGNLPITVKDKEGVVTAYGYALKDLDAEFYADFDKDGKVWQAEFGIK
jgi:hypothetical protein